MDTETREIFLTDIDEPTSAMRTEIPRDAVFELTTDIKKNGLINPITVRPRAGRFEVVAGHRRFLAHRYGGMSSIRCIVRELSDDEAFAIMTSENLKREDVNAVDEASHVARLLTLHNNDVSKVADIVNRGRDWVESRATIAAMPEDMKAALRSGQIKIGAAMALAQIDDDTDRAAVLAMAISQGASVPMAQYYLAQWKAGLFGHALLQSLPDANIPEGERQVVMLTDGIDGKQYPATEFATLLYHRGNTVYVDAMREYVRTLPAPTAPAAAPEEVVAGP